MKKFTHILTILLSVLIYRLSSGRIQTKKIEELKIQAREKNRKRIEEMQAILDEEHSRLRGWTKATYSSNPTRNDPARERMLDAEIRRAHNIIGAQA